MQFEQYNRKEELGEKLLQDNILIRPSNNSFNSADKVEDVNPIGYQKGPPPALRNSYALNESISTCCAEYFRYTPKIHIFNVIKNQFSENVLGKMNNHDSQIEKRDHKEFLQSLFEKENIPIPTSENLLFKFNRTINSNVSMIKVSTDVIIAEKCFPFLYTIDIYFEEISRIEEIACNHIEKLKRLKFNGIRNQNPSTYLISSIKAQFKIDDCAASFFHSDMMKDILNIDRCIIILQKFQLDIESLFKKFSFNDLYCIFDTIDETAIKIKQVFFGYHYENNIPKLSRYLFRKLSNGSTTVEKPEYNKKMEEITLR